VARVEEAQVASIPIIDLAPVPAPSQPATDRIWMIIVVTFAVVLLANAGPLILAVFKLDSDQTEHIQILLTIITTVAGILAGFVSGRISSGGSTT
jgi:hypothetical protein